ncbi:MAG: hypothetical protein LBO04_08615 [Spirochaetaceae bacterium]|jgi:hypothetical protein|nr:hypothetical protein [Spirochaetaceae bacterium]
MKTIRTALLCLCIGGAAIFAGCAAKTDTAVGAAVRELTETGYFTLLASNEKGRYGPVIVFPERHDSRLIQAEDAYALDLLAEKCGLSRIALEGMFEGETFDGITLPAASEPERTKSLLWLLESVEIKAPEFMYLVNKAAVFGIENPEEYEFEYSDSMDYGLDVYLQCSVILAKQKEMPDILKSINDKINAAEDYAAYRYYLDQLLELDSWTKESWEIINNSIDPGIKRLRELLRKCDPHREQLGITDEARNGLLTYISFLETAEKRSDTMSRNVERALKNNNGIIAMIIGAAHTEDIERHFRAARINYYVLEPSGLAGDDQGSLSDYEYSRKREQKSIHFDGTVFRFLEGTLNTRSVLGKKWLDDEFSLAALILKIANAAAGGDVPPYGLDAEMLTSGALRIPPASIEQLDEHRVMFQVSRGTEKLYVKIESSEELKTDTVELRTALRRIIENLVQRNYQQSTRNEAVQVVYFPNCIAAIGIDRQMVRGY